MEPIIKVDNVSMCFNLSTEKHESLKEYLLAMVQGRLQYDEFYALKDVSLDIMPGDFYGLVGLNGSGKSTLLKTIAGVYKPTRGKVTVNGTIAPLIELGAGFDMDLTARENIYLNGTVLGFSPKYLDEKFDEIVEFSELQNFLDVPLKNYSSGMVARIGFAIATITKPDILIADEVKPDAKEAIAFLKRRDAGRATFLPMSAIRGDMLREPRLDQEYGFVGIASELCRCETQYAGIRDSLLGRTVVAENLDRAAEIARKLRYRFRVVSLDGQVVNAGGSFTGGSAARNSGLLSRAAEIERIRGEAQKLYAAAEEAAARFKTARQEAANASAELDAARSELTVLHEDEIRFAAEITRVERDVETQKRQYRDLLAEQENAAGRIASLEQTAAEAAAQIASLEADAEKIRARMEDRQPRGTDAALQRDVRPAAGDPHARALGREGQGDADDGDRGAGDAPFGPLRPREAAPAR